MLDTMVTDKKRVRRNHSPALKAQILAECSAPGASVAQVAMAHGINANIVHGWRKLAREALHSVAAVPAFLPVKIETPAPALEPDRPSSDRPSAPCIDIELRRGPLSVHIAWPLSAAVELSAWTRELLR
jgi:transposase